MAFAGANLAEVSSYLQAHLQRERACLVTGIGRGGEIGLTVHSEKLWYSTAAYHRHRCCICRHAALTQRYCICVQVAQKWTEFLADPSTVGDASILPQHYFPQALCITSLCGHAGLPKKVRTAFGAYSLCRFLIKPALQAFWVSDFL